MSDNRYFNYGCPPLMQDGRFLTSYIRRRIVDQFIRNVNEIDQAQEYRLFLQTHGDEIMNRERAFLHKTNTCPVHGYCAKMGSIPGSTALFDCGCNCINN
jgi:hypothetical protein